MNEIFMEIYQIRYFLAICKTRNFTRAAEASFVSQPSLTQAIKKLEHELGGELFIRNRSGCQLTELGSFLHPKLEQIYNQTIESKALAIRFTRLKKIPVRLGLIDTIGAHKITPTLVKFQRENPHTEIELITGYDMELINKLQEGDIDLLITPYADMAKNTIEYRALYQESYVVAYNHLHHFSQYKKIELKDMQSVSYIDRLNCELREKLMELCATSRIKLYANYRSNSEQWILNLVRTNMDVALIPEYSIPINDKDISFQYLKKPEIKREVFLVNKHKVSIDVKMMIEYLIKSF